MRESKFSEAMRENQWTRAAGTAPDSVVFRDVSRLWALIVVPSKGRVRVSLLGPSMLPSGFPVPADLAVESSEAGPFGWPSTAAAMLARNGFILLTNNRRKAA